MNINKYTEKAREAVATAVDLATGANNPNVEPEHLLVALLEQREGIVPEIVRKLNADPAQLARGARELLKKISSAYGGSQPAMSARLKIVTDQAQAEADRLADGWPVTPEAKLAHGDRIDR